MKVLIQIESAVVGVVFLSLDLFLCGRGLRRQPI